VTAPVETRVLDDPAAAAAELIAEAARAGGHVALSGGSTVGPAYHRAAQLAPDWSAVEVWLGDERAVPPDDERSNYRTVRETLLDLLEAPPAGVHRVEGERGAVEAAQRYHEALEGVTLDFALNGIGPDGHTASLFPNADALDEIELRAVATEAGLEPFVARVTMTRPVFEATGVLVFLATGAAKAAAVRRAFAEEPSPATPASLVRGRRTVALLDRAAALQLDA
jgi:6-phosphogluconolactonase